MSGSGTGEGRPWPARDQRPPPGGWRPAGGPPPYGPPGALYPGPPPGFGPPPAYYAGVYGMPYPGGYDPAYFPYQQPQQSAQPPLPVGPPPISQPEEGELSKLRAESPAPTAALETVQRALAEQARKQREAAVKPATATGGAAESKQQATLTSAAVSAVSPASSVPAGANGLVPSPAEAGPAAKAGQPQPPPPQQGVPKAAPKPVAIKANRSLLGNLQMRARSSAGTRGKKDSSDTAELAAELAQYEAELGSSEKKQGQQRSAASVEQPAAAASSQQGPDSGFPTAAPQADKSEQGLRNSTSARAAVPVAGVGRPLEMAVAAPAGLQPSRAVSPPAPQEMQQADVVAAVPPTEALPAQQQASGDGDDSKGATSAEVAPEAAPPGEGAQHAGAPAAGAQAGTQQPAPTAQQRQAVVPAVHAVGSQQNTQPSGVDQSRGRSRSRSRGRSRSSSRSEGELDSRSDSSRSYSYSSRSRSRSRDRRRSRSRSRSRSRDRRRSRSRSRDRRWTKEDERRSINRRRGMRSSSRERRLDERRDRRYDDRVPVDREARRYGWERDRRYERPMDHRRDGWRDERRGGWDPRDSHPPGPPPGFRDRPRPPSPLSRHRRAASPTANGRDRGALRVRSRSTSRERRGEREREAKRARVASPPGVSPRAATDDRRSREHSARPEPSPVSVEPEEQPSSPDIHARLCQLAAVHGVDFAAAQGEQLVGLVEALQGFAGAPEPPEFFARQCAELDALARRLALPAPAAPGVADRPPPFSGDEWRWDQPLEALIHENAERLPAQLALEVATAAVDQPAAGSEPATSAPVTGAAAGGAPDPRRRPNVAAELAAAREYFGASELPLPEFALPAATRAHSGLSWSQPAPTDEGQEAASAPPVPPPLPGEAGEALYAPAAPRHDDTFHRSVGASRAASAIPPEGPVEIEEGYWQALLPDLGGWTEPRQLDILQEQARAGLLHSGWPVYRATDRMHCFLTDDPPTLKNLAWPAPLPSQEPNRIVVAFVPPLPSAAEQLPTSRAADAVQATTAQLRAADAEAPAGPAGAQGTISEGDAVEAKEEEPPADEPAPQLGPAADRSAPPQEGELHAAEHEDTGQQLQRQAAGDEREQFAREEAALRALLQRAEQAGVALSTHSAQSMPLQGAPSRLAQRAVAGAPASPNSVAGLEAWLKGSVAKDSAAAALTERIAAQKLRLQRELKPLPRVHGPPPPENVRAAVRQQLLRRPVAEQMMRKVLAEVAARLVKERAAERRRPQPGGAGGDGSRRSRQGRF